MKIGTVFLFGANGLGFIASLIPAFRFLVEKDEAAAIGANR
jgi:hypothetical protein